MSITFLNRTQFKTLYGARIYAIAKNIEKLYQKRMKINEQINFLKKCKGKNVIPKGLQLKNVTKNHNNDQVLNQTMEQLRNNSLKYKYKQQRFINIELNTQLSIIKYYLEDSQPCRQHIDDLKWINKYDKLPRDKLIKIHERKLKSLIDKKQQTPYHHNLNNSKTNTCDTSNVINISNINLTIEQLQLLSKGLKFAPTASSINVIDVITNTEKSLYSTTRTIKQAAIAEINNFITKWKKPSKTNLTKTEIKLMKEIKCNPNIIVVPADKGGKIVVMDRAEYIKKVEEQLNDTKIYEAVNDPTNKIKSKICKLAGRLFKKNRISEPQKYHFHSIKNLPTIRGQPKIHKQGNPMRIITCTRSTITSSISQFTFNMIQQLRETIDNCVTNPNEFISEISETKIEDDEYLVSLDVKDLFTNIPINQAINIVLERVGQSEAFCTSTLTKSDLKELLMVCLQNSYFTFNNKFFRQKTGLPMGNTLSPLLPDLYMDQYVKNKLSKINDKLWRYVDDLLIITKMNED